MGLRAGEAERDLRHVPCAVAELNNWILRDGVGHVEIGFQSLAVACVADLEIGVLSIGRIVFNAHAREVGELKHGGWTVFKRCEERCESIEFHERRSAVHTVFCGSFNRDGL